MLVPPNLSGQMTSASPIGSTGSTRRHRRLSSLNTVSWPNPNELTVSPRPRRMSTVTSTDQAPQVINLNIIDDFKDYLKILKFLYILQRRQMRMKSHLHRQEQNHLVVNLVIVLPLHLMN